MPKQLLLIFFLWGNDVIYAEHVEFVIGILDSMFMWGYFVLIPTWILLLLDTAYCYNSPDSSF